MTERRASILVADDEPAVLEVCLRILKRAGYQVQGASGGAEALALLASEPFDLLLTDIKMPDVDGLQILRRVKESDPELPVVLITGYGSLDTAIEALQLGAEGFLLKPFHGPDLQRAVEDALRRSRLWRENVRLKALLPLLEASHGLVANTDPDRIYQTVADMVAGLDFVDGAWLFIRGENGFQHVASAGGIVWPEPALLAGAEETLPSDLSSEALKQAVDQAGLSDIGVFDLIAGEKLLGFLVAGKAKGHPPFDAADRETLSIFARQATIAIENARLFKQIKEYADHLEEMVAERTRELQESEAQVRRLYETLRQLQASLDLDQTATDVLRLAMSIAGAARGSLRIADSSEDARVVAEQGEHWETRELGQALELQLYRLVKAAREPILIADWRCDARRPESVDVSGSALGLPLMQNQEIVAILLLQHPKAHRFKMDQVELLLPVCAQAAAVLENARVFRATSERLQRAYAELQERARQLEMTTQQLVRAEKLALIGQLAAGISHEMGNIVAPLQMYADLVANASPGDRDYVEYACQIKAITERAKYILRQFTDFARPDSSSRELVDVREVVAGALSLLEYPLQRKNITVRRDDPASLPKVLAHPRQLEQVFINIIVNAMDAMPSGGELFVSTRAGHSPSAPAGYVEIAFRDTGCGIAPEHLERVFEPFFTTKEPGKGTGLGLFISYGIIEGHGGSINIESKLGQGTTLTVRLPLPAGDAANRSP